MRLRTLGAVCATCAVAAPTVTAAAEDLAPAPDPPASGRSPSPDPPVAGPAFPAAVVPADLRSAGHRLAVDRHVALSVRHQRMQGERLPRSERRELRDRLGAIPTADVHERTRALRVKVRRLAGRLARKAAAGGPIPAALESIARCESGGDPRAVSAGGTYRGKYQFARTTWSAIGGSGDPAAASEAEQDRRAALLYRRSGAGQWPVCGR